MIVVTYPDYEIEEYPGANKFGPYDMDTCVISRVEKGVTINVALVRDFRSVYIKDDK